MNRKPEPSPGTTRVSLLERLRKRPGDLEAWSRFVKTYGPLVTHWCREQGLQEADAADVAQEALLGFWQTAANFEYDPSKRFRGYLRMIVLKTWSDWARRDQGARVKNSESSFYSLLNRLEAQEDLITRLERMFDTEVLERAMARVQKQVDPQHWQAFQLLAVQGISGKQAAEKLGMNLNTVFSARYVVQRKIQETIQRIERNDVPRIAR